LPATRIGILSIRIRPFSQDSELLAKILEKPPEALAKIGDKDAQELYLKEKVVVDILERFEFEVHEQANIHLTDARL
jgi:hypothetical protein